MPPSDYATADAIEMVLPYLANKYPSITYLLPMPYNSLEGRAIRSICIGNGTDPYRRQILLLGGVHAREMINPDMLVTLAYILCYAYTNGGGLTFKGKFFDASTIKKLVESVDIWFFPLVNPDGRVFVQDTFGDAMWRKNRRRHQPIVDPETSLFAEPAFGDANSVGVCKGVDVNRNFDFLFSSGIDTSTNQCHILYKGTEAFSEPETRNIKFLLDGANITVMVDLHSFGEMIIHPWGDDNNQTNTPNMNFLNPAFDGLRGKTNDSLYQEFIPQSDLQIFQNISNKMRMAISEVRGRFYTVKQGALIYPGRGISANTMDYAYSRNFRDPNAPKVFAFALETGTGFQPPYAEAWNVMTEVMAGLIEFCLQWIGVPQGLKSSRGKTVLGRPNAANKTQPKRKDKAKQTRPTKQLKASKRSKNSH